MHLVSPSNGVDCDGVGLAGDVGDEARAVGSAQLPHVDGVAKPAPVGRVVAEPVHSRVIRPVQVTCYPVG